MIIKYEKEFNKRFEKYFQEPGGHTLLDFAEHFWTAAVGMMEMMETRSCKTCKHEYADYDDEIEYTPCYTCYRARHELDNWQPQDSEHV